MTPTATCLTIGSEFAEQMGYTEYVGATAMLLSQMSAVSEVVLLSGEVGKELDIHTADCLTHKEQGPLRIVLLDHTEGIIFFSEDNGIIDYALHQSLFHRHQKVFNVDDITALFDVACRDYPQQDWKLMNLDDDSKMSPPPVQRLRFGYRVAQRRARF